MDSIVEQEFAVLRRHISHRVVVEVIRHDGRSVEKGLLLRVAPYVSILLGNPRNPLVPNNLQFLGVFSGIRRICDVAGETLYACPELFFPDGYRKNYSSGREYCVV